MKGNGNGKDKEKQQEPVTTEAIITLEPSKETAVRAAEPLVLAPVMDIGLARRRLAEFQEFVRGYLVEGEDFGTIPGTPKPTLLKPGADKLCELYGLADSYKIIGQVEDFAATPALFDYTIECSLHRGDRLVSTGLGSCNSYEGRYRWREAQRVCPVCKKATIIKGKEEFGGGYICWKKKDGCGASFKDGDPRIESQQAGRVLNDDIPTLKNTILKISKKRAKIDATLAATRSSGIFTQDLEDTGAPQPETEARPRIQQPTRSSERTPAQPPPQPPQAAPVLVREPATITTSEIKLFFAAGHDAGYTDDQLKVLLRERYGIEHTKDIPISLFNTLLDEFRRK